MYCSCLIFIACHPGSNLSYRVYRVYGVSPQFQIRPFTIVWLFPFSFAFFLLRLSGFFPASLLQCNAMRCTALHLALALTLRHRLWHRRKKINVWRAHAMMQCHCNIGKGAFFGGFLKRSRFSSGRDGSLLSVHNGPLTKKKPLSRSCQYSIRVKE